MGQGNATWARAAPDPAVCLAAQCSTGAKKKGKAREASSHSNRAADLDAIDAEQQALVLGQGGRLAGGASLERVMQRGPDLGKRGAVEQGMVQVQYQAQLAPPADNRDREGGHEWGCWVRRGWVVWRARCGRAERGNIWCPHRSDGVIAVFSR